MIVGRWSQIMVSLRALERGQPVCVAHVQDRRPASNLDPYVVCRMFVEVVTSPYPILHVCCYCMSLQYIAL